MIKGWKTECKKGIRKDGKQNVKRAYDKYIRDSLTCGGDGISG